LQPQRGCSLFCPPSGGKWYIKEKRCDALRFWFKFFNYYLIYSMRNLVEQGKQKLFGPKGTAQVDEQVNLLNRGRIRAAEGSGQALTTRNEGRTRVAAVVSDGEGKVRDRSQSMFARVGPIFEEIIEQAGKREVAEDDLQTERERVSWGSSLSRRAKTAQGIRKAKERNNRNVARQQEKKEQAAAQLEGLLRRRVLLGEPEASKQKNIGLSRNAKGVLAGAPRAGLEKVKMDPESGIIRRTSSSRGEAMIPPEQIINGTFAIEVKVDPLSRAVNKVRGFFGRKPIKVISGAVVFRNRLTDENEIASVVDRPFETANQMRQVAEALRIIGQPEIERQEIPTFADLGLDGKQLLEESNE
jgi:uncharacterized protein YajQ (UPF0234 family)